MQKVFIILCLLGLLAAMQATAQDKSAIVVKSSELSNGVVILTVHPAAAAQPGAGSFALHCNKDMTGCKALEPGNYVMVRLPKNWGLYDCANVEVYASTAGPATSEKLGEYCLIGK